MGVRVQLHGIRDEASTTALYTGVGSKRGRTFFKGTSPRRWTIWICSRTASPAVGPLQSARQVLSLDQSHQRSEGNGGGEGEEAGRHGDGGRQAWRVGGVMVPWSSAARASRVEPRGKLFCVQRLGGRGPLRESRSRSRSAEKWSRLAKVHGQGAWPMCIKPHPAFFSLPCSLSASAIRHTPSLN
jgi:hypothetical protein